MFYQFKTTNTMAKEKNDLVDEVIETIKVDMFNGDCTVLEELLYKLPNNVLVQSLPEERWVDYKNISNVK